MSVRRTDPPFEADERTMLESWLEYHRATLEMKCAGLTREQLIERAVPPSSMSLLGLIRHMAEVERNWFRKVLAGEEAPYYYVSEEHVDADFDNVEDADVDADFATWRNECEFARKAAAEVDSLDAIGKKARHGNRISLRWIFIHMIEEYARHNGHADFLRERIDGSVGE
jgi:hypothetical protein